MPPRTTPTERQKRLGSELRRIRTASGMSAEFAAGLLGVDRGKISNIESGVRGISADRLRTLACNCDVTDEKYVEALVEMTRPASGWWERYRGILPQGLLDIAEIESHAVRMRGANTVHVPGVLQTSEQAMAIFRAAVPPLPEHEVALRLALRAERQQVVTGDKAVPYVAVIHEAALRMQFGGPGVARAQLEYLLDMSDRDNVTVLVLPFAWRVPWSRTDGRPHRRARTAARYGAGGQLSWAHLPVRRRSVGEIPGATRSVGKSGSAA